uniref:Uncharacterized protein n=1 Tax=Arundo donax TaxID=35708 RepID=A0A0A8XYG4_ARUDO
MCALLVAASCFQF